MTRREMVDMMVRVFGYEHPETLKFAGLCELWESTTTNDKILRMVMVDHISMPWLYNGEGEEEEIENPLIVVGYKDGKMYKGPRC